MKPLFVCVHVFYPEMWDELKQCILNMSACPYELYITLVSHHALLEKDIAQTFPTAHVEVVENRGYDVGPFMSVLNKLDLNHYSYVVKLHTKRDMPEGTYLKMINVSQNRWREYLLKFFKSPRGFQKALSSFAKKTKLGMLADWHVISSQKFGDPEACTEAGHLLKTLGLKTKSFCFVAGTMFMCRANLLKPLQNLGMELSDFELSSSKTHGGGGKAHALERLFGLLICAQGYTLEDDCLSWVVKLKVFGARLKKFVFHKRRTNKDFLVYKLFGISVHKRLAP